MGRGGGLVFTGMPRRREVLGTGIIRWEKVVNPDGSVTWQEAQPTTASGSSKKEEKSTKAEKQKLERPSWIETKKESTNVRVGNTTKPAKEVEDIAAQEEPKVEEVRPRRAFSFHQAEEKEKVEREEKTSHVEEVRLGAPIRKDEEKKGGFVAGLATKFGSSTRKAEDVPTPKKHHTLHVPTEEKQYTPPPPLSPPKDEKPPIAEDYFSHSHWSIRDDSKQESDAELALRLANTEKIFRQQEQKIQAALDRIRDLERQLASGFTTTTTTTSPEQEADQTETKTWDNESIVAGGRESGPHFRQLHAHAGNSSKGPLPCLSGDDDDDDDEPPFHYRVLTVNSNKPRVTNANVREQLHRHYESITSADVIINNTSDDDNDDDIRTPSPIAVSFNLPVPAAPKTHPMAKLTPITSSPKSFVLQSLQSTPATRTTNQKHKPLPLLPTTDARAVRPGLRSPLSPSIPSPTTPTTPSPTTPTKPSFCIPPPPNSSSTRPRPTYHRSVSNFKKGQRTRPLTPIPEEPCPLKRRPRVPRMRRSISRSLSMSMTGDCGVQPGSGLGSGRGQCGGGEGGRRGALDRVRTN